MPDSFELVKFIASFAILIVMMYALYYYLNRLNKNFSVGGKDIQILETKILGKNRSICLAKVKGIIMLLACDESGIKILKEWKEDG